MESLCTVKNQRSKVQNTSTIITNRYSCGTYSESVEDRSPPEGLDDDELITDGIEMIEEEYEDVEEGD